MSHSDDVEVPPHRSEVHVKRQAFIVTCTLHHVPEKHMSVDVTDKQVTISTEAHSKKFRLVVAIPKDVVADSTKASSELFPGGVLKVVVPLKKMAESYTQARDKIHETIKENRNLRFGVSKDGDLITRTKKVSLAKREREGTTRPTKAPTLSKSLPKVSGDDNGQWQFFENKNGEEGGEDQNEADIGIDNGNNTSAAIKAPPRKQKTGVPSQSTKKHFVTDKEEMLRLVHSTAHTVEAQLQQKHEKMEELQRQRNVLMQMRAERKVRREENSKDALKKIIEEKRDRLNRMMGGVEMPEPSVAKVIGKQKTARQDDDADSRSPTPKKRVSFKGSS
eukprot:PhF_6_TR19637/c0_g1_i1/m.28650